ncbi:uncharacterized protein IAS62_006456 [Cryptococcus decagattii]|uniref:Uncharacterized protein n=1 Tax=Cryptococcus decagattii TaxID=1859122 RepID=A0ABZ2B5T8_9TREE
MRVGKNMMARKIPTAAPAPVGPICAFFQDVPIPVDVYPLVGIVVVMCSGATYMLSKKDIYKDLDHIQWAPQRGGVKFLLPSQ